MSSPHGRALGRGWGVSSSTPPGDPARVRRGLLERLIVYDFVTGEPVDLGPVRPNAIPVSMVMGAGLAAPAAIVTIPADHGFLLTSMRHVATSNLYRVTFRQQDNGAPRDWQDQAIDAAQIFGTGTQPFNLWEPQGRGPGPQFLPPDSTLEINATDLSGAGNTALIVLEGAWIAAKDHDLDRLARWAGETLFVMVKQFVVPAGVGFRIEPPDPTVIIKTAGDAPPVLHYINCTTAAGYNINFKAVNEDPWFDAPIPIECLAGTGPLPGGHILPRGIAKGQELGITAVNRTAGAVTTRLHLICSKDWRA